MARSAARIAAARSGPPGPEHEPGRFASTGRKWGSSVTRQANSPVRFIALLMFVVLLGPALAAAAACGGDGGDSATPSPKAQASPTQGAAGTITVSLSSPIVGQKGTMLLIFATAQSGGPQLARVCVPITSDSFSPAEIAMSDMPGGQDPCGGSTPTTVFPPATYSLSAGIYAPPAQSPDKSLTRSVPVSGSAPARVELDGASLSK